jgi:hypothetical protein
MAAASEIEKKRAAAAEEQVEILAEINARLIRIEAALLAQPVSSAKARTAPTPGASQE